MKKSSFCLGLIGLVALSFISPQKAMALDAQYLRNGECYLLIGEGNSSLRGVYRLNNPEKEKYFKDNRVITGTQINNTLGFNVDLDRVIYTFTEVKDSNWSKSTEPLYRQVIDDGVTARVADYGQHAWIHYDHRSWKTRADGTSCANVYRTGPAGRNIKGNSTSNWSGFKSAGPGTPATKPAGYTLPAMTGSAQCDEYSGKQWYTIPNESWYSSWRQGNASGNSISKFYFVFGDRVDVKYHNFNLYTWNPRDNTIDTPDYSNVVGSVVAQTKEEKVSRNVYAGCLDGCGGASGSGSAEAASKLNDIAFQPPLKTQPSRTYFYQRTAGKTDYEVKMNNNNYNPVSGNPLIGRPASTDTFWLCISLRNSATDYVYCMGTSVIKDWYEQAFGSAPSNMNITAVTVSNQWSQDGGIVYAYDKANKKIYKFERKENEGAPISKERFLALDLTKILSEIGANSNMELDDIKADGFGSLYFALSHPAKSVSAYDPRSHFKPNDCIHVHESSHDTEKKETIFNMVYCQEYGKKVYQRDYLTGDVKLIGTKNYATRYYTVSGKVTDAGWNQIKSMVLPNKDFNAVLASWSTKIGGNPYTSSWPTSYYIAGLGGCGHYKEVNYNDPGNCKLAVINVPTPPKVYSLADKKSYLDIIGPYDGIIAMPDKVNRHTNQSNNLVLKSGKPLGEYSSVELKKLYFYMVENYPLDDGAQDPRKNHIAHPGENPDNYSQSEWGTDWDEDGRVGGFITALQDPAPYNSSGHPSGVQYEWKTWMVMDQLGNSVCDLTQQSNANDSSPYNYFYSPVFGKFIMTCRVKYNWYDYDALTFGSTVDDLSSVLRSNVYAIPVGPGSKNHKKASEKLNDIINTFEFRYEDPVGSGNYTTVKFMKNPIRVKEDYTGYESCSDPGYVSKILGNDEYKDYFAMIPIDTGNTPPPPPTSTRELAAINRCDCINDEDIIKEPSYISDSSYWSKVPTDTKVYGILSNEAYFWRLDLASQTNMLKDISAINGTNANSSANYNYIATQMLNPNNETYYKNKNPEFQFLNQLGDTRWKKQVKAFTNKKTGERKEKEGYWLTVSASLKYQTPDGEKEYNGIEDKIYEVVNGKVFEVDKETGEHKKDEKGNVIPAKTFVYYPIDKNELPPTDPKDAELRIEMSRWYEYDMWAYYNGQPMFSVKNIPNQFTLTGSAKIRIMDVASPTFDWRQTNPINLFGITGKPLAKDIGPSGNQNPEFISFVVKDNNPWEGVNSEVGITLDNHIKNYAYNFGGVACANYCANNTVLKDRYEVLKPYCSSMEGIKSTIETAKKNNRPTSSYNYKPLFSKYARDARLSFETVKRDDSNDPNVRGRVIKDKADVLFKNSSGRDFAKNNSNYAVHWHNGVDNSNALLKVSSQNYKNTSLTGEVKYESTVNYKLALADINIGTEDDGRPNNIVPDGYANNTPGYGVFEYNNRGEISKVISMKPYKFYVSAVDSSGNVTGELPLNMVLNVKDDIPPVGYGTMKEMKNNTMSYFPYKVSYDYSKEDKRHYAYRNDNSQSFYASMFNDKLIYNTMWLPENKATGYINGQTNTYKAVKSMGDDIVEKLKDSVMTDQVKAKLSPIAVEDNIPCEFYVYCNDNCGNSKARLSLKYYTLNSADGSLVATNPVIISNWSSGYYNNAKDDTYFNNEKKELELEKATISDYTIASNSSRLLTLFRGEKTQFPMALPLVITTVDDARDWDYYKGCNYLSDGTWTWEGVEIKKGDDANKTRTFKTTVPVYGTELDIRTLDKTIKND